MARLDIQLGVGIGQIKLGMHPDDVVEAFAEGQICEHWMGGNLNDAILFHGLRLHFDKCSAAGPLADSRSVGSWYINAKMHTYLIAQRRTGQRRVSFDVRLRKGILPRRLRTETWRCPATWGSALTRMAGLFGWNWTSFRRLASASRAKGNETATEFPGMCVVQKGKRL